MVVETRENLTIFASTDSGEFYHPEYSAKISCIEFQDITQQLNQVRNDFQGFSKLIADYAGSSRIVMAVYFEHYSPSWQKVQSVKYHPTSKSRNLQEYLYPMFLWFREINNGSNAVTRVELARCSDLDIPDDDVIHKSSICISM